MIALGPVVLYDRMLSVAFNQMVHGKYVTAAVFKKARSRSGGGIHYDCDSAAFRNDYWQQLFLIAAQALDIHDVTDLFPSHAG